MWVFCLHTSRHLEYIFSNRWQELKEVLHKFQLPPWVDQVARFMQLILVMPATNATLERSFGILRSVQSYLRSIVLLETLNYQMIFNVHQDMTESLHLKAAFSKFVRVSVQRANVFGKYV